MARITIERFEDILKAKGLLNCRAIDLEATILEACKTQIMAEKWILVLGHLAGYSDTQVRELLRKLVRKGKLKIVSRVHLESGLERFYRAHIDQVDAVKVA